MKFLTFESDSELKLGLKLDDKVVDLKLASESLDTKLPTNFDELFGSDPQLFQKLIQQLPEDADFILNESNLVLGPAVLNPGKIICVGLNYRKHAVESGMAIPTSPVLFSKFNNAITATEKEVNISGLTQVDYEAELAVVIGKQARNVPESEALDYVYGYANSNDLSERELQFLTGQWLIGKTIDDFLPIGPYLVTADEAGDPTDMSIKGWLNDEERQNSNTADMIFSVAEVITYLSKYMTLEPGDVICTGTPEGVILGFEDKVWMKPGDTYSVEIGNLGKLTNTVV